MSYLPDIIRSSIIHALIHDKNPFDAAMKAIGDIDGTGATTLSELTNRSTTAKGLLFEQFCAYYLTKMNGFVSVYWTKGMPDEWLQYLRLQRQDKGIDLVGYRYEQINGVLTTCWYAIQCKYRSKGNKVTHTELSTFYNLANRTGLPNVGWAGHIVMTNASKLPFIPSFQPKDRFVLRKDFQIPDWYTFIGYYGNRLGTENQVSSVQEDTQSTPQTLQELRDARCRKYNCLS